MTTARRYSHLILAAFILLVASACGDGEVSSNTELAPETNNGNPKLSDAYFMVPAGEKTLDANVTESIALEVFLYSKKSGEPVEGQSVEYEILESDTNAESLSSRGSTTTADGAASVDLRTGAAEGTVKVRADHPSANAVDFTVRVKPLEVGDLKIALKNTAPSIMTLQDIDVRLYKKGDFTCGEFRPLFGQPDALMRGQAPSVNEDVTFEQLGTLETFVVTGIARGDRGQIAAAGCLDGAGAQADVTTTEELLLQLIPLNPVGTYDVTSNWDFTEAVKESGTVGQIIVRVLNVFENPGQAIYDEIINLIDALIGSIVGSIVDWVANITGGAQWLQDQINNAIENNDTLRKIRDAGRDVRDVIANLEVQSELTIGKLTSDYEFRGSDNWLGITLYWRWNCDANSPPDCGAIPLEVDSNGEIGSLGVLSSEWTGRVTGYNQLQIDTHTLSLRYGRLIIYILNDVILPGVTDGNAHSLSEAFAYWIGCGSLASSVGDLCALGECVTEDQIESFCSSAVSTLFGFADLLIKGLEFDIGLHLGGEGVLVETTSDGRVDFIEEGTFTGYMQSSEQGAPSSPFSATWEAERINNMTDGL